MDTQPDAAKNELSFSKVISFLSLPAELRIEIYRYHLIFSDSLIPVFQSKDAPQKAIQYSYYTGTSSNIFLNTLDICLVSKQVCQETLPIFYSDNHFRFSYPSDIHFTSFFAGIGPFRCSLIRSIRFEAGFLDVDSGMAAHLSAMQAYGTTGITLVRVIAHFLRPDQSVGNTSVKSQLEGIKSERGSHDWLRGISWPTSSISELYWSPEAGEVKDAKSWVRLQLCI